MNFIVSIFKYSIRKDTKIRIFNACVKSVLLYGCETWLVISEIRSKIQTFVNRRLKYIPRIWWPNIPHKDLWKATGQEDITLEIGKRKFRWIDHTLRKEDGEIPTAVLLWNP
jgi:ribosomal protein L28